MVSNAWSGDWAVTQPWGCTPLVVEPYWQQAQCHWHCGVDVGMPTGTQLYAARAGRVAYVGYGLLIIQVTPQEADSYVHIDSAQVAVGAQVAVSQAIARSGARIPAGGSLTGPHLHFEVQAGALNKPATSLDPIPVLQAVYGGAGGVISMHSNDDIWNYIDAINGQTLARIENAEKAIKAAIGAPAAAIVDQAALTAAVIAAMAPLKAELDAIAGDVATTKRLIEKDLAP